MLMFLHCAVSGTDSTDTGYLYNPYSFSVKVEEVTILPKTAVATHASNYITTTIANGATTLGTHTTNSSGGSALAAGTQKVVSLVESGTKLEIAAGGVLAITVAKQGTGPAYNHQIVARCSQMRAA